MTSDLGAARTGTAAGVPFLAVPPAAQGDAAGGRAPLVVVWHLMDPPRSEAAMAAAVPLAGVPAWRVYLGLPMTGARMPAGGPEEIMRLGMEDALRNLLAPAIEGAAAELPAAVDALRRELPVDSGPIGLVGGSAGGAAVLLSLASSRLPIAAAAVVNPVVSVADTVALGEQMFGVTYPWDDDARAVADRLDFVARAGDLAARDPQVPLLLMAGEKDDARSLERTAALRDALADRYADPAGVELVTVPDLPHALADEPGIEPAPQSPGAAQVDAAVTTWLARHLR